MTLGNVAVGRNGDGDGDHRPRLHVEPHRRRDGRPARGHSRRCPPSTGRITDITRLTPQYGGSGTFAGQDNRANNVTVDGSYFNNSFGLGVTTGGIGDRTGVAPISLEAIEQVQVNVAPYDVRQGNFTGAGVNTVTRSGTNRFTGVGLLPDARRVVRRHGGQGAPLQPRHLRHEDHGRLGRRSDHQEQAVRLRQRTRSRKTRVRCTPSSATRAARPVTGNMTRVLCSDLAGLQTLPEEQLQVRHRRLPEHLRRRRRRSRGW